jgi:SAM-dependent methyltransferase
MICRICDFDQLVPVLDLGLQPWANHFLKSAEIGTEPKYPLRLIYCKRCSCVQLDYTVPKETMFADHTYVSGTTKTLAKHFYDTACVVDQAFFAGKAEKSLLDIGSNDGTQLQQYKKLGYTVLGVESCKRIADIANSQELETVVDYFNEDCARRLERTFDVINASGVFFHLEELHSAAKGVKSCLADDGVFVVQFLYMKSIVENLAFDQIYHEHLLYYTVQTIKTLLERHGLEPFDAYLSPIHGGSIVLFAAHEGKRRESKRLAGLLQAEEQAQSNTQENYLKFAARVAQMKSDTISYLDRAKAAGKTIFGFGAPVKGNTFLNYCQIGTNYLDVLVEKNPLRRGMYSPGMHIPIVLEGELSRQPDIYLVLAWNFKKEILQNNQELLKQGVEFYFPVNPAQG